MEEVKTLFFALDNNKFDGITTGGFKVAGQNYTFTNGESDSADGSPAFIHGRCKEADKSAQGVAIYLTTSAIIIGVHHPEYSTSSFGKANIEIGRIADYFVEQGF